VPVSSITVCSSVGTTPTDSLSEGAKLGLFSILYKIKKKEQKLLRNHKVTSLIDHHLSSRNCILLA